MIRGDLRNDIMEKCPEDFEDELKDFIDTVEQRVGDIRDRLNITDINQINHIEDAFSMADELADWLY